VSQLPFLSFHASEARRRACPGLDPGESSIFSKFWMPAFAGMTVLMALSAIMTQSLDPESMVRQSLS